LPRRVKAPLGHGSVAVDPPSDLVRTGGERSTPIVGRVSKGDSWVVELIDAFNDELIE
jgi:hypothetical protein